MDDQERQQAAEDPADRSRGPDAHPQRRDRRAGDRPADPRGEVDHGERQMAVDPLDQRADHQQAPHVHHQVDQPAVDEHAGDEPPVFVAEDQPGAVVGPPADQLRRPRARASARPAAVIAAKARPRTPGRSAASRSRGASPASRARRNASRSAGEIRPLSPRETMAPARSFLGYGRARIPPRPSSPRPSRLDRQRPTPDLVPPRRTPALASRAHPTDAIDSPVTTLVQYNPTNLLCPHQFSCIWEGRAAAGHLRRNLTRRLYLADLVLAAFDGGPGHVGLHARRRTYFPMLILVLIFIVAVVWSRFRNVRTRRCRKDTFQANLGRSVPRPSSTTRGDGCRRGSAAHSRLRNRNREALLGACSRSSADRQVPQGMDRVHADWTCRRVCAGPDSLVEPAANSRALPATRSCSGPSVWSRGYPGTTTRTARPSWSDERVGVPGGSLTVTVHDYNEHAGMIRPSSGQPARRGRTRGDGEVGRLRG